MKKVLLIAATLIPVAAGYILNMLLMVPSIGTIVFYILPFIVLAYWFYIGKKYSETDWNIIQSALIGNAVGLLFLLLYLWQFLLLSDNGRNLFLAGLSQMFVACTNLFTARIALLIKPQNAVTQIHLTAMQILGLALMVIVFLAGYILGKRKADKT